MCKQSSILSFDGVFYVIRITVIKLAYIHMRIARSKVILHNSFDSKVALKSIVDGLRSYPSVRDLEYGFLVQHVRVRPFYEHNVSHLCALYILILLKFLEFVNLIDFHLKENFLS